DRGANATEPLCMVQKSYPAIIRYVRNITQVRSPRSTASPALPKPCGFERRPDDIVTLAGGGLEPGAVQNRDLSARVANQPCAAQRPRRDRHGAAPRAEHLREELVLEQQLVGRHAI